MPETARFGPGLIVELTPQKIKRPIEFGFVVNRIHVEEGIAALEIVDGMVVAVIMLQRTIVEDVMLEIVQAEIEIFLVAGNPVKLISTLKDDPILIAP